MSADSAAETVLSYYSLSPPLVRRIEPLGNTGGWSGSRLWRVQVQPLALGNALCGVPNADLRRAPGTAAPPEFLCLRRWPGEHPDEQRLKFIHQVLMDVAARDMGDILPVPKLGKDQRTYFRHAGHFWELTPWLPGQADYRASPNQRRLQNAMQILMRFHRLTARRNTRVDVAPCLAERSSLLRAYHSGQLIAVEAGVARGICPEIDVPARRLLTLAQSHVEPQLHCIEEHARKKFALQPAIRDIHHDHVLFTGDSVTGLIDFGAMRI